MANLPQKSSDVSTTPDVAEILDPEVKAYANVEASISLPDLEVEAAANVGAFISPPGLDVEVSANVGPFVIFAVFDLSLITFIFIIMTPHDIVIADAGLNIYGINGNISNLKHSQNNGYVNV